MSSLGLENITQNHRELIKHVKLPNDVNKCPYVLVHVTTDKISVDFFTEVKRGPTQLVNYVLLVDTWTHGHILNFPYRVVLSHCTN